MMLLQRFRCSLFHVLLLTFFVNWIAPYAANAVIITRNLNWTGDGGNTLTGTFTGEDANSDGIIQAVSSGLNSGIGINEFTLLTVTLTDINTPLSQTYTSDQLLAFNTLNFNYDIANDTILQSLDSTNLLQGSAPSFSAGLSIGDGTSGFILESLNGSGLVFVDSINSNNDSGGTLTAVPWETDVLPLIGATILFGGGMWLKRRRATQK